MQLPTKLSNCVHFARFAHEHGIDPLTLGELVQLARRAFSAGVAYCNRPGTDKARDRAYERFEAKAKELGFGVQWGGLWPSLTKGTRTISLPDVD
jgi:hypothetical protein